MAEEIKFNSSSLTQEVIKRTVQEYAPDAITNKGGYTYINGSLMPKALSRALSRSYRTGRIIRPGVGMTEKFIESIDPMQVMSITVQQQVNIGIHTRTLRDDGKVGTPYNDGLINTNHKLIPATKPFTIPVRQINDQPLFFPRLQLETMLFDEVAETLANFFENEVNSVDSYHIAKMISYAIYRAFKAGSNANNIITLDKNTAYDDLAMIKIINQLNAAMADGDSETELGAFRGRRQLTLRNELLGYLRSPKTGYVTNTEKGANVFYTPGFDLDESMRTGEQYRGSINGYEMYEMNSETIRNAEIWLGLEPGSLDGVLGIVSTPLSYASGGVSKKSTLLLQSTEHDGIVGFPLTKFGGAAYRQIFLIVDKNWNAPDKLKTTLAPAPVVAPKNWDSKYEPIERVIYDEDGNPTGMTEILANVIAPNGDTTCSITIKVTDADGNSISNATIASNSEGATIPFTNNGDGTYQLLVRKNSVIDATVTAAGYTAGTINVTAKQSMDWMHPVTITLATASASPARTATANVKNPEVSDVIETEESKK